MDETHNREEEWITVNFLTMMSLHNYSVTEQTPKRTTAKRPGKATATLSTEGGGGNTSVTKRNIQDECSNAIQSEQNFLRVRNGKRPKHGYELLLHVGQCVQKRLSDLRPIREWIFEESCRIVFFFFFFKSDVFSGSDFC